MYVTQLHKLNNGKKSFPELAKIPYIQTGKITGIYIVILSDSAM